MKHTLLRRAVLFLTVLVLLSLCACGTRYHAAVYSDRATELVRTDFAAENLTGGVYLDGSDTVTDSETYPRSRAFVVDTQEKYDEIFTENAPTVDFDREMLVLCTYTSHYVRPVSIVKLRQQGSTLSVTLKEKQTSNFFFATSVGAACQPYQRYVILKLDKLNVTHVNLTVK